MTKLSIFNFGGAEPKLQEINYEVPKKIIEPEKDEVNEQLNNDVYVQSRKLRWVGHVANLLPIYLEQGN